MDRKELDAVYAPPGGSEPELPPATHSANDNSTRTAGWMVLVQAVVIGACNVAVLHTRPHTWSGYAWFALQFAIGVGLLRIRDALIRPLACLLLAAPLIYLVTMVHDGTRHATMLLVMKLIGAFMLLTPQLLLLVGRPSDARRRVGLLLFVLVQSLLVLSLVVTLFVGGRSWKRTTSTPSREESPARP